MKYTVRILGDTVRILGDTVRILGDTVRILGDTVRIFDQKSRFLLDFNIMMRLMICLTILINKY